MTSKSKKTTSSNTDETQIAQEVHTLAHLLFQHMNAQALSGWSQPQTSGFTTPGWNSAPQGNSGCATCPNTSSWAQWGNPTS